ncbi:HlyD family efflux transporter periplasmic adaptor subunit [Lyngbya aestuarii]|uniref:HlyD family efflux transporter periplasmic adaptor subunit n=1 Tax=Lyngbya aestuarii TaxID=118322 RepID=UPI00403DE7DB
MNQRNGSKSNQPILLGTSPALDNQTQASKSNSNGNGNGNGKLAGKNKFDKPVILRQSKKWSHAILWTIIGVTTGGLIWASVAQIEQAIPAQGKLEPQGTVNEVKAPSGGVVTEIHIKDGERVEKGDVLITFEPKVAQEQITSLSKVRATLMKENQFYRSQLRNSALLAVTEQELPDVKLSGEIASLTESRKALLAENEFYQALLNGDSLSTNIALEERGRFIDARAEQASRVEAAQKEVEQLQEQRRQNQTQLQTAISSFRVEQGILEEMEPLAVQGAVPRIQYLRQQEAVKEKQTEVDVRTQENARLGLEIAKAGQQLENTKALTRKELNDQIAANKIRLAEIDSQLNKVIVENEKQIAEIDSQLSQANLNLSYQELRAPVSGTVFDLQPPSAGYVANSNEPVLKIVPSDALVARVYLTNKDIGFVKDGMPADVRIESFPYSEFGDIEGELQSVGSDALPPAPQENRPDYTFPAEISLKEQSIVVNDRTIPLQSGMRVNVNIKVRQRSVLSIFTELFTDKTDSLQNVR